MKTQQECYEALVRGERLHRIGGDPRHYVHLVEGNTVDQNGRRCTWSFCRPEEWEIWTPPKHRVWVNLYNTRPPDRAVRHLYCYMQKAYYATEEQAANKAEEGCVGQIKIEVPENEW